MLKYTILLTLELDVRVWREMAGYGQLDAHAALKRDRAHATRCLVETRPPAYCVGQEKNLPLWNTNPDSPVMQSIDKSLYYVSCPALTANIS